ncbi:MAG TPA: lamin tail domain-containing protein [Spongiibacteraceae bacterium]|nr:lamin tail domain-containing protein [Spongiibacteraceae bacterium]
MSFSRRFKKSITHSCIVTSFALCAGVAQAAIHPGDLVITEVLANPDAVSDTAGEWFEIYNASASSLDLSGLVIRDQGSNVHTVSGDTPVTVASGSYFVFGRNGDPLVNGGYTPDYVYDGFVLGNSSDVIILELGGVEIASLIYSDAALFGAAGISAELTAGGFALTPSAFTFGSGDIGTPGAAGSYTPAAVSSVPLPAAGWLMLSASGALVARRRKSARTNCETAER